MSQRSWLRIGRGGLVRATRLLAFVLLLALALTIAGLGAAPARAYATADVIVSGTVYADDGETPVPGCLVRGTDGPGGHTYTDTTDADGHYELTVPPAEPLDSIVRVEFDPYDTNKANGTTFVHAWYGDFPVGYADAEPIDVSAGDVSGKDQILMSGARVSGRVTDETSAGVSASVGFYYEWMWSDTPDYVFETDASGDWDGYVLEDLYNVRFVPDASPGRLVPEWYRNASSREDALGLYIAAGGRTGIDAVLGAGGYISGTVTDPGGAPVPGVSVYVYDESMGVSAEVLTDSSGHYETAGLLTGDYTVLFQPGSLSTTLAAEFYDDKAMDALADQVHVVVPAETPGVSAQLGSGATIAGRITDASGTPVPGVWIQAMADGWGGLSVETYTDAAGDYSLAHLPRDTYTVWYDTSEANEALDRDYVGTSEYPVDGHADATITLDKVLATGARISGTVTGPTGAR
jgi:hypothetical protein